MFESNETKIIGVVKEIAGDGGKVEIVDNYLTYQYPIKHSKLLITNKYGLSKKFECNEAVTAMIRRRKNDFRKLIELEIHQLNNQEYVSDVISNNKTVYSVEIGTKIVEPTMGEDYELLF